MNKRMAKALLTRKKPKAAPTERAPKVRWGMSPLDKIYAVWKNIDDLNAYILGSIGVPVDVYKG